MEDQHAAGGLPVRLGHPALFDVSPVAGEGDWLAAIWVADFTPMFVPAVVVGAVEGASSSVGRADVSPGGLPGVEQWRELVSQYPWNADEALRVMACESGGDPNAIGGANYGLMQINAVHQQKVRDGDLASLFDPAENLRVAALIYADQGWSPWACRP